MQSPRSTPARGVSTGPSPAKVVTPVSSTRPRCSAAAAGSSTTAPTNAKCRTSTTGSTLSGGKAWPQRGSSPWWLLNHSKSSPAMSPGRVNATPGCGRSAVRTPSASARSSAASTSATCTATECIPPPKRSRNRRTGDVAPSGSPISMELSPIQVMPPRRSMPGVARLVVVEHATAEQRPQRIEHVLVAGGQSGGVEHPPNPSRQAAGRARRHHVSTIRRAGRAVTMSAGGAVNRYSAPCRRAWPVSCPARPVYLPG